MRNVINLKDMALAVLLHSFCFCLFFPEEPREIFKCWFLLFVTCSYWQVCPDRRPFSWLFASSKISVTQPFFPSWGFFPVLSCWAFATKGNHGRLGLHQTWLWTLSKYMRGLSGCTAVFCNKTCLFGFLLIGFTGSTVQMTLGLNSAWRLGAITNVMTMRFQLPYANTLASFMPNENNILEHYPSLSGQEQTQADESALIAAVGRIFLILFKETVSLCMVMGQKLTVVNHHDNCQKIHDMFVWVEHWLHLAYCTPKRCNKSSPMQPSLCLFRFGSPLLHFPQWFQTLMCGPSVWFIVGWWVC